MKCFNADKFSLALQLKRKFYGLSQREVGELCGMSNVTISTLERGGNAPDLISFIRLCDWLDMDMKDFIFERPE